MFQLCHQLPAQLSLDPQGAQEYTLGRVANEEALQAVAAGLGLFGQEILEYLSTSSGEEVK